MNQLNVLIVDDEPWAREGIRLRLMSDPRFNVVDEADNGSDALLLMQNLKPDLVFMDIEMPTLSGLQVAYQAASWFSGAIVFITAYSEYAVEAFELEAFHYLVKPIKDSKFQQVLDKLFQLHQVKQQSHLNLNCLKSLAKLHTNTPSPSQYLTRISLKDNNEIHMIDVDDIYYIESAGNYIGVTTRSKTYIQRMTIKQMNTLLNPQQFVQCHRSTIINKKVIDALVINDKETLLKTKDGKAHSVSRRYQRIVKQLCQVN